MLGLHKLTHHFLPHFLVSPDLADSFGGHDKIHHRAHWLSAPSLFIYLQLLVVVGVVLFSFRVNLPKILGDVTFSSDEIIAFTNIKRA